MPQSEHLEVLVLGSGTGGRLIAWYMAQSGRRTAVVERHWVGGSCPNIGIFAVQAGDFPGLRRQSPENGNIRGVSRRLSPNSILISRNPEYRDKTLNHKSPPLAGFSATIQDRFAEPRTAWLAAQC